MLNQLTQWWNCTDSDTKWWQLLVSVSSWVEKGESSWVHAGSLFHIFNENIWTYIKKFRICQSGSPPNFPSRSKWHLSWVKTHLCLFLFCKFSHHFCIMLQTNLQTVKIKRFSEEVILKRLQPAWLLLLFHYSNKVTHVVSENSQASSLWTWLKECAPDNLPNMHVLDITWFTDSMRERRPVAVETRHLIEVCLCQ